MDRWVLDMVKQHILDKANNVKPKLGSKYDIWDKAFFLHNGVISDEFRGILERL